MNISQYINYISRNSILLIEYRKEENKDPRDLSINIDNLTVEKKSMDNVAYLDYDLKNFQSFYDKEYIREFNHGPCTKGSTDLKIVSEAISILNKKVDPKSSVYFEQTEKERQITELTGGSCSSIALRICREYLLFLQDHKDATDKQKKDKISEIRHSAPNKLRKNALMRILKIWNISLISNVLTIRAQVLN